MIPYATVRSTRRKPNLEDKSEGINILMIDDHPSQVEGYSSILRNAMPDQLEVTRCFSFEDAFAIISSGLESPGMVFLDMTMPSYAERNIFSGEDMAKQIRKFLPDTMLVIITAHTETFLLYNIIRNINPEGILVKSDFHATELQSAVKLIMSGEVYYSETVRHGVRELLNRERYLDYYNRQIIMLLAQGIRTKQLPDYINMSLSAIEKRKAQLKDYFCLDRGSDDQIVSEARKLGFI